MADQRSTIEDHVTCCICMDLYEDPIALPCMHSFCRKCLLGVHSSSLVVKCPECRTDTKLGRQGIDGLPRNFQLGCIVESYRKDHRITTPKHLVCSEHGSKCQLLCETCKQSICISCLQNDYHTNHRITITDEDKHSEDATLCDKHQRDIVSYCRDCVMVLCLECIITTHRSHCLQTIDEAYIKSSQIMDDTVSNLESRRLLLKATQKSCKTMTQKLQMDLQRKSQELSVYFDRLRDSLDKRELSLRRELETRQKSVVEVYLSKAEQASKKGSKVVELMNNVKRLLTADKQRFLQEQKTTTKRVEELLDNECNDVMPRVPGLDHVMLQTTSLDEQLTSITWKWPDQDNKSARKAPPIPAQRKSKPRTEHSDQLNGLKQGSPVQRGPHWNDAMRDGGPGHYGTVIQTTVDTTVYLVRWPNGNSGEYKYVLGIFEEIVPP